MTGLPCGSAKQGSSVICLKNHYEIRLANAEHLSKKMRSILILG
jgi:hypothetical protein